MINFWASWCPECRVEAPALEAAWQRYAPEGVVFIRVAYADADERSQAHLEEFDVTYPNALDWGGEPGASFGVTGTLETYIIDREGDLVHRQIGRMTPAMFDQVLGEIIAGNTIVGGHNE